MSEQDDIAALVRSVRARVPMDAAQMLVKETPERIGMVFAELPQMLVERPIVEELLDDELHEILHVRIGALLDLRELIDDRLSGDQPTQSQTRRQHFRKTIQIDDDGLRIQRVQ